MRAMPRQKPKAGGAPAPSTNRLIVHFGELWLRGKNRREYISLLKRNIYHCLSSDRFTMADDYDRLIITPGRGCLAQELGRKVSKVFGVSAYEIAYASKPDLASIARMSVKVIRENKLKDVKINSHRSYKGFKFNSVDIIQRVASEADRAGISLSVRDFKSQLYISVKKDCAFIYPQRFSGAGGLPVGSSGKCVVLLSGGIDSPVSAWYAMKRGLEPVYVHVHGFASNSQAASSKIPAITRILSGYYKDCKTYYVPSHIFQLASINCGRYELILLKAFMLKVAESIAAAEGAGAIVTGESLGQVASQTLPNLAAEQYGIKMPVIRPLIGFDKQEIIRAAEAIGTYQESIKPYKDVCSINSNNPVTRARQDQLSRLAQEIGLDEIVSRSVKESLQNTP